MIKDFNFKKKFGQNFITDKNLLDAIVDDAGVTKESQVLEIGAGAGTLTERLSERAKNVVAVEIDKDLTPYLKAVEANHANVKILFDDFMKMAKEDVESNFSQKYEVVANLPYYITTPIIFKLLEEKFNISSLTLMVQKEVAERFVADEKDGNYGAVSVMLQSQADLKVTRVVPRSMFYPQPNVDSAVIKITINENKFDIPHRDVFAKVVKSAFGWRRKTLNNCLQMGFGFSREIANQIIEKADLPLNVRGEKLAIQDFIKLSNIIFELEKI